MIHENNDALEEILEKIWVLREDDRPLNVKTIESKLEIPKKKIEKLLADLEERELLTFEEDELSLTKKGEGMASRVIRHHRLAERLFNDVIEIEVANIEGPACKFEHAISADVEEKICTLLGHPDECPHGNPIPEGQCCLKSRQVVRSAIASLDEVEMGKKVKVAYISLEERRRLDRLSSLGILPGTEIEVKQKFPSFVVDVDGTKVAMQKEVGASIYVRVNDSEDEQDRVSGRGSEERSIWAKLKEKFREQT